MLGDPASSLLRALSNGEGKGGGDAQHVPVVGTTQRQIFNETMS